MVMSRYLCILPRMMVIFENIYIFCINVSKNSGENIGINMQHIPVVNISEYGSLFTLNVFHNTPIIFVSLVANFSMILGGLSRRVVSL